MAVKTYSSKSNCKRAAIKAAIIFHAVSEAEVKASEYVWFKILGTKAEGFHFEMVKSVPQIEDKVEAKPSTKVEVGVSGKELEVSEGTITTGETVTVTDLLFPPKRVGKIQKVRPTQNGVTRPTAGGKCARVWEICDELACGYMDNRVPFSVVRVKAEAEDLSVGNARAEYAAWRKFNGVTGRIVEPKA